MKKIIYTLLFFFTITLVSSCTEQSLNEDELLVSSEVVNDPDAVGNQMRPRTGN